MPAIEDGFLPDDDVEYLNTHFGGRWELKAEGDRFGLIISRHPIPNGYAPRKVNLMILIPQSYPAAQIDMFYFSPPVSRSDNQEIGALQNEEYFGVSWQRWSRHYEWRAGVDSVATHLTFVENQLKSEISG